MRLKGKTAFVTAAGVGIGRAIAAAFLAEGAEVHATDIDEGSLAGLGGTTFRLDVTDSDALREAVEGVRPEVLVNCAGFVHAGDILKATDAEFDAAMALNARPMLVAMRAAIPHMQAAGVGSIINIASVASSMRGLPNRVIYSASKGAVIGMTKAVAADHITQGIRANCICPGTVDTPSLHDRLRAMGDYEAAKAAFMKRQPMERIGRPDEIAEVAVYLASDASAYMTGQEIAVDGGLTL